MRVAFDTRPSLHPHGVGRYTRCLLQALADTAPAGAEIVQTHRPGAADVFHAPWMEGAMLHSPCPMVVTLHTIAPLKRRSEHLRLGVRLRLRELALQRAVRVIVPTQALACDALACLGLAREHVVVVPQAPDPLLYPRSREQIASVRKRYALPERYLLWVGGAERPNATKQLAKLAAAPRELPLVLVGLPHPWAHELDERSDVTLTGHVGDQELAAIYSGAHALMICSDEEGFGLPAVEALACGTPVAAFEAAALREGLEDRAEFVPAGDLAALVGAAEAARRPAASPPPWSWHDAGRATWRVYEHAAARLDWPRAAPARRLRGTAAAGQPRLPRPQLERRQ